jgi:hypothetical protein
VIAIGNGTLVLPRLALHRETVLALAGGGPGTDLRAQAKSKNCSHNTRCFTVCYTCPCESMDTLANACCWC